MKILKANFLELLGDCFIIAFAVWSIITFYSIITAGGITYIEPNSWIARGEFIFAWLILLIGLRLTYKDIKAAGRSKK